MMLLDFTSFLAASIISDGKIVTYRTLSRDLKVHVNVAKRMLYDFHHSQTTTGKGAIHATYLLRGLQKAYSRSVQDEDLDEAQNDIQMQSGPFISSSVSDHIAEEPPSLMVITLVGEEHLEAAKQMYDQISSVHIYSLEPGSVQNLEALSDVTREIDIKCKHEDPPEGEKQYGTIQNSRVQRRNTSKPLVKALPPAIGLNSHTNSKDAWTSKNTVNGAIPASAPSHPRTQPNRGQENTADLGEGHSKKPAGVKREQSDIFKAFSRPSLKKSLVNPNNSNEESSGHGTPLAETQNAQLDVTMKNTSEDEQEEDFFVGPMEDTSSQNNLRSKREAQLRKMMDDDDDVMEEVPNEASQEAPGSQLVEAEASQEETSEATIEVSSAHRRGRRRVMKKKMLKDEEGYLVTKEEPAWESFSEEEVVLPNVEKMVPAMTSSAGKSKKIVGVKPKGNIMSFFGKK